MNRLKNCSIAAKVLVFLFAGIALSVWTGCHTRPLSPFEQSNAKAVQNNPEGLRVELRTRDNKSTFQLYENIPIDLIFSSSTPETYSIELSEGMNAAGSTNHFVVDPVDTVFENDIFPHGIVCCGSDRPFLRHAPTVLHRDLTNFLRFEKPGRYQVFYSTRRVFQGKANPNSNDTYHEQSAFTATSNVLTLTILPDDPQWDAVRLSDVLQKMADPKVLAEYERVMGSVNRGYLLAVDLFWRNELPETELERARTELRVLDSEEAIEHRVTLIPKLKQHSFTNSGPITSTVRPDRMFAAMQKRAEQADFAVDDNYAACWSAVLAKRDHPELFRPTEDEQIQKQRMSLYGQARAAASKQILQLLEASVPQKIGMARTITKQTIQDLRANDEKPTEATKASSSDHMRK